MSRDKPDFGHAVENGFLRYTSVSAVQAFDPNTYGGCNRKFYFTRVLHIKEPTKKSQEVGLQGHGELEHYLKHGEDVLGPFARSGKHLLPKPGSDLSIEEGLAAESDTKAAIALRVAGGSVAEVERLAGFAASGVPFVGYVDLHHRRGEYIDGVTCTLRREESPSLTAEVVDHKFVSNIDAYAKTAADLPESIQMVVYGNRLGTLYPGIDRARLGHINYQTRGAKCAKKVSVLVPIERLIRKKDRIDSVVRAMVDVAHVPRIEDVEAYGPSCDAFRGCHFMSTCPSRPMRAIHDLLNKGGTMSGTGLFSQLSAGNGVSATVTSPAGLFVAQQATPPVPPPPPLPASDADRQAAVDVEKKRLLDEDSYGVCTACSTPLSANNASRYPDGRVAHIGCSATAVSPPPPPPVLPRVGAVNPPDAPLYDPVTAAAPLSPEAIVAIEDLELRKRAEDHAAAWRAAQPPPPPSEKKSSGKCPGATSDTGVPVRVKLTQEQAAKKRFPCPECGKVLKIKPSSDFTEATLPGHLMSKSEESAPPPPAPPSVVSAPPVPPPYVAPSALPGQTAMPLVVPPVPPAAPTNLTELLQAPLPPSPPPPAPPPPVSPEQAAAEADAKGWARKLLPAEIAQATLVLVKAEVQGALASEQTKEQAFDAIARLVGR